MSEETRPPCPPFTIETAVLKRPFQKDCSVRLKMFQQTSAQPSLRNAS